MEAIPKVDVTPEQNTLIKLKHGTVFKGDSKKKKHGHGHEEGKDENEAKYAFMATEVFK